LLIADWAATEKGDVSALEEGLGGVEAGGVLGDSAEQIARGARVFRDGQRVGLLARAVFEEEVDLGLHPEGFREGGVELGGGERVLEGAAGEVGGQERLRLGAAEGGVGERDAAEGREARRRGRGGGRERRAHFRGELVFVQARFGFGEPAAGLREPRVRVGLVFRAALGKGDEDAGGEETAEGRVGAGEFAQDGLGAREAAARPTRARLRKCEAVSVTPAMR
jgi:hypothetical protein